MARIALSIGVAAAVAAILLLLPPDTRLPAAAAVATCAFGVYALRERGALRSLLTTVRLLVDLERSHGKSLATVLRVTKDRAADVRELTAKLDEARSAVERNHDLGKELSTTHAAAIAEVRVQLDGQRAALDSRLENVEDRLDRIGAATEHMMKHVDSAVTQSELRRLHKNALAAARREFQQTEALLGLHSAFRIRAPLPPSRRWAASPDLLLYLTNLVLERRPRLVLELGGGLSTLWLAYAVERVEGAGRIISIDHDPLFAERTRQLLSMHALDSIAEVRCAPLSDVEVDGEVWPWYDRSSIAGIANCDILVVDGPPGATRDHARYPALPLLAEKLAEHSTVVVDDCIRSDEKDVVSRWSRQFPEWQVEMMDHEKGTAVLTR